MLGADPASHTKTADNLYPEVKDQVQASAGGWRFKLLHTLWNVDALISSLCVWERDWVREWERCIAF